MSTIFALQLDTSDLIACQTAQTTFGAKLAIAEPHQLSSTFLHANAYLNASSCLWGHLVDLMHHCRQSKVKLNLCKPWPLPHFQ